MPEKQQKSHSQMSGNFDGNVSKFWCYAPDNNPTVHRLIPQSTVKPTYVFHMYIFRNTRRLHDLERSGELEVFSQIEYFRQK